MRKTGNLFELAEKRLIKEKREGIIPCYTALDVIEYAIEIRRWLDKNPRRINQVMKLTKEETRRNNRACRRRYYLKYGK